MDLLRYYTNLGLIINVTPEEARALVEGYNKGDLDFFEGYFKKLRSANLVRNRTPNITVNETLFVRNNTAGKGMYGEVTRNRNSQHVYKVFAQLLENRINFLKMLYKEVIIQAALQDDVLYGKHVCRIFSVYRKGTDAVLKLEALSMTMLDAFKLLSGGKADRSLILRDFLVRVFEALVHFRRLYGFRHYDLHTQNIMTTADADIVNNLKLIDFGLSYIKIGGVEIGTLGGRFEDGFNFCNFAWMMNGFSEKIKTVLNDLQDLPEDTPLELYLETLKTKQVVNADGGKRKTRRRRVLHFRNKDNIFQ